MAYKCYFCEHETEVVRSISPDPQDDDYYELLCENCYADWLLSLKG